MNDRCRAVLLCCAKTALSFPTSSRPTPGTRIRIATICLEIPGSRRFAKLGLGWREAKKSVCVPAGAVHAKYLERGGSAATISSPNALTVLGGIYGSHKTLVWNGRHSGSIRRLPHAVNSSSSTESGPSISRAHHPRRAAAARRRLSFPGQCRADVILTPTQRRSPSRCKPPRALRTSSGF